MRATIALLCLLLPASVAAAQEHTVTLWHAYDEGEAEGLAQTVRAFEAAHPDIDVRLVHNAFGGYAAKLEAAIPTGHGPDVFLDAHERLATYVDAHLVAPLPRLGIREAIEFEPAHLDALRAEGELYALPINLKCAALYVSSRILPEDPASLEDLVRTEVPSGSYPLVFEAESAYYVAAFVHAFGGELIASDGEYGFDSEQAIEGVSFVRDLVATGAVPDETNGDLVKQLFVAGRAAAVISGPWLAPQLPSSLEYRVVPLPPLIAAGGRPLVPYLTIEGAYLAANNHDRDAAVTLIEFLAGPEGSLLRATHGRQIVAARSVWLRPELESDTLLRTFYAAARRAKPMPAHPNMRAIFEPAARALRKVMRGEVDPAAALAECRHRFDDVTRPLPPPREPMMGIVALGLCLLLLTAVAVKRAREPAFGPALRASLPAYKYVAHAAIAVGLLVLAPLVVGAATSLFAGRGTTMHYVGIQNYVDILTARGGELLGTGSFYAVLIVTVAWTALNLFFHVGIGVGLALLLHRPVLALKPVYRVLLILPWAVPSYVTALAWKGMFHRQFGAMNAILEAFGAEPISWFARFSTAFFANVCTNVWLGFPFMMVVTLGALTAIPNDLYEAAAVDGATPLQRFKLITWPLLLPQLAPAVAMGAVWTFNMFNVVFLVSGGEPDGTTEILVSEAYRWAFTRSSQYGYAAAYAVLIFGLLLIGTRAAAAKLDAMGSTR